MSDYLGSAEFIGDLIQKRSKAFNALFECYFEQLFGFAFSIIKDDACAEDIVTESISKLYQETWRFPEADTTFINIKKFLFVVVRNRCLDYLKSNQYKIRSTTIKSEYEVDIADESIGHEIIRSEITALLYKSLKKLPPERRMALKLLIYDGYTYKEAAEIMGVTIPTLKNYRRGGVAQMKGFLTEEYVTSIFAGVLLIFLK